MGPIDWIVGVLQNRKSDTNLMTKAKRVEEGGEDTR
jgi:hypothetical protein